MVRRRERRQDVVRRRDRQGRNRVERRNSVARRALGHRRVHLERPARARRRRCVARHVPGGVSAGAGGARGDPRHHGRQPPGPLGPAGSTAAELHAIVILFARDVAERERCEHEHAQYLAKIGGVRLLGSLDLEALPPYGEPREHFGYLDRLTDPPIEGTNDAPTPGSLPAVKAGEFFLGYPDESGATPAVPEPRSAHAERQLPRLFAAPGARRRLSRIPESTGGPTQRGTGTPRREADGTLAQRRAARPCAGARRPGARHRPPAHERLRLREDGSATATPARSARTSGA